MALDFAELRATMVRRQLERRGITDARVLHAMGEVPRERFVPARLAERAYADAPLPIGAGQTMSQPYMVALMAEAAAVEPDDHVLEVGAGSGYAAAVLGRLAGRVTAIERHRALAEAAAARIAALRYGNVEIVVGDGTAATGDGIYDAIVVSAAGTGVPETLRRRLKPGGRLVMPVGGRDGQQLLRLTRRADGGFDRRDLGEVMFVPLVEGA